MELSEELKTVYIETAAILKGSERRVLVAKAPPRAEQLPTEEALRLKLNQLGYQVRSVQQSRPQNNPTNGCYF